MPKSRMSMRLLGTAAVIGLLGATSGIAQAVETKFGDFEITFDTTVSMGASMRTVDRETSYLPETNGGPVDPRGSGLVINSIPISGTFSGNYGSYVGTLNSDNYDGSINTDDGRLNFDKGDLIGGNVKANHDLIVKYDNYTFFARAIGFYDVVLNDPDAGDRSTLNDKARGQVGRNYNLLDLFVSADYTVADMPVNLRVGKQVINWGESTFILGGNNVFNPIDVSAFRRPGAEIKEALLPVNAISGSITLPESFDNIAIAAYYALDWEQFQIDPSGTPFSGSDVGRSGSAFGGNDSYSFVTGSPYSGNRRNCIAGAGSGTKTVQTNGLLANPLVAQANLLDCTDRALLPGNALYDGVGPVNPGGIINYSNAYITGTQEEVRVSELGYLSGEGVNFSNNGFLARGSDDYARDDGQFGVSVRYLADFNGGTELAAYYQRYHSRLPIASIRGIEGGTTSVGFFINGDNTQLTAGGIGARQLNPAGCGLTNPAIQVLPGDTAPTIAGKKLTAGAFINGTLAGGLSAAAQAKMKSTVITDPGNVLSNAAPALLAQFGIAMYDSDPGVGVNYNNAYAMAQLNCALAYYQSGFVDPDGAGPAGNTVQSLNGAEFLIPAGGGEVFLEYPEDIDAWGASFNTTVLGWGLQGDFVYRKDAPFQVDTDSLTVASLINGCLFDTLYGAGGGTVDALGTPDGSGQKPFCGSTLTEASGVIRNDMYSANIGTTATFTQSEWFIDGVGADLGIFVTEIGMVYVPDVENTWVDNLEGASKTMVTQYQNIGCNGTDLPAAGIVGLDTRKSYQCRPTDFSAGLVVLYSLQYNNAFNTGFLLSPTIAYSYDFEGTTAAPYSTFLEDRQAVNLGVTGTLNNNFRAGASYTAYFGGHERNKSRDQDYASVTASYSF